VRAITGANGDVGDAETRKQRIARQAATFAAVLPDYVEGIYVTKWELWDAWASFCEAWGQEPIAFSSVLYLQTRWRVIVSIGPDRFKLLTRLSRHFKRRSPADRLGALDGERPRFLAHEFSSPLPEYRLPDEFMQLCSLDVYEMQRAVRQLLQSKGLQAGGFTDASYKMHQHAVLFAEEVQMKFDIALYDLELSEQLPYSGSLHKIWCPGLAEKRPSVLRGDAVVLECKQGKFTGYVHNVLQESVEVSFHRRFQNIPPFTVKFTFTRTPLKSMHRAIDELDIRLDDTGEIARSSPGRHPKLNKEQREFLSTVSQQCSGKRHAATGPLFLWGPPGTGKTTTLVNTVQGILRQHPSSKILVTAPSNPACDLLCERLANMGVTGSEMLRLVAVMRDPRLVDSNVREFTRFDETTHCFKVPTLSDLQRQRVVVATCSTAAYIRSSLPHGTKAGWFSHVFVDEAAQAMEAEVLIPVTLLAKHGCLCFAGDFKQLGPVIRSPVSIEYGLQTSLMGRIVEKVLGTNHSRVMSLLDTYRAHPSILKLYNKTVYADVLRCCSPSSSYNMETWTECPHDSHGNKHPLIFHHCCGEETRVKDSPSWQNGAEADILKGYLMKLLAASVRAEDIGIISPYHKQCQHLNFICKGEGVDVEVGTTELFQGREKRVILISTVRSRQEQEIGSDMRFTLGFLGNYRRTNVAVSRARSLLVVVGNLSLLSRDATWHNIIALARERGCIRGSPFKLQRPTYGENSEWAGSQPALAASEPTGDGAVDRPWREPW